MLTEERSKEKKTEKKARRRRTPYEFAPMSPWRDRK
jgi:hypothetical protein